MKKLILLSSLFWLFVTPASAQTLMSVSNALNTKITASSNYIASVTGTNIVRVYDTAGVVAVDGVVHALKSQGPGPSSKTNLVFLTDIFIHNYTTGYRVFDATWGALYELNAGEKTLDWYDRRLYSSGASPVLSIDWGLRYLRSDTASGNVLLLNWQNPETFTSSINAVVTNKANVVLTNDTRDINIGGTSRFYQVRLTSSAWDDMLASALAATRFGSDDINEDTTLGGQEFETTATTNAGDDHVIFLYQVPHRRKTGTVFKPHVHFWQTNADQTNTWYIRAAGISIGSTNTADMFYGPATNIAVYTAGTMHQLASFPDMPSIGISGIVRVRLFRNGTVGTGNITATDFDLHYEVDGFGSDNPVSKSY